MTTQTKKKVSSKIVALLLTALLLLTMVPVGLLTTVFAAGTEFTVAVTDAEETPSALEGATVTLTPTDETLKEKYTYQAITAADGMAAFAELTAAMEADEALSVEFELVVSKDGYQTNSQAITVNNDNKTAEIPVKLVQTFAFALAYTNEAAQVTVDGTPYTNAALPVLTKGEHTVKVTPNEGYVLTNAMLNGTETEIGADNTIKLNVTQDVQLGLTLVQQFVITVDIQADGTVSYNNDVTVTDGGKVYALPGSDNTFKVEPAANYKVESVKDNEAPVNLDENGTYTITSIDKDHTLTVKFVKVTNTVTAYACMLNANGNPYYSQLRGKVTLSSASGTVAAESIYDKDGNEIGQQIEVPFDERVSAQFIPTGKTNSIAYKLDKVFIDDQEQVKADGWDNTQTMDLGVASRSFTVTAYFTDVPVIQIPAATVLDSIVNLTPSGCTLLNKVENDNGVYLIYSKPAKNSNAQDPGVWVRPLDEVVSSVDLCGGTQYLGEAMRNNKYVVTQDMAFGQIHVVYKTLQTIQGNNTEYTTAQAVYKLDKPVYVLYDQTAPELNSVKLTENPDSFTVKQEKSSVTHYNDGIFGYEVAVSDRARLSNGTTTIVGTPFPKEVDGQEAKTVYNAVAYLTCTVQKVGKENLLINKTVYAGEAALDEETGTYTFPVSLNMSKYETGTYTVTFTATDASGNISKVNTQQIVIDNTAPTLAESTDKAQAITFEQENKGVIASVLNKLTFGYFFNEKLTIKVKATDNETALDSATMQFYSGKELAFASGENEKYDKDGTFTFSVKTKELENFEGSICVVLTDKVGNVSEKLYATTTNSNLADKTTFMIENTAPTISVSDQTPASETTLRNNMSLVFTVSDKADEHYSGVNRVNIYMNGADNPDWIYDYSESETKESNKEFDLPISLLGDDGKTVDAKLDNTSLEFVKVDNGEPAVTLEIEAVDNAGNVSERKTFVYRKDTTAPIVTNFAFSTENGQAMNGTAVTVEDYGFYFHEETTVTITAQDSATENEIPSGVVSITYYIVDAVSGEVSTETPLNTNENGEISFKIPANFKGQIYARPTDAVGNTPASCGQFPKEFDKSVLTENGYVHPNATVIENSSKHKDSSAILIEPMNGVQGTENGTYVFDVTKIENAQMDAVLTENNANNVPLYNQAVSFNLTVQDTYSGIKEIKTVLYYQDTDGTQKSDEIPMVVQDESKDVNLITKQTATVEISNNHNDMTLAVILTDNAGNTSYDYYTFGIDTTKPIIRVEYDNNDSDAQYTDYFKADRTATITVQERNLDLSTVQEDIDRVLYEITNTDGVVPQLEGWEVVNLDEKDPDNNTYKATIRYTADGDYTFAMSCTDRAGNANADILYGDSVAPAAFTIDKTLPVVTVAYDNNTSKTGTNFYDAQRVASITVVEHNFDVNRVIVTGLANDDGAAFAFPATSAWTHDGDTHTATITYAADGKYNFDIAFADMASNGAADYAGDEFYVDNTDPVPSIAGTEVNGSTAFNDLVTPQISCTDKNIDVNRITVTLRGTDKYGNAIQIGWNAGVGEAMSEDGNTKSYTLNCLNEKLNNAFNKLFDGDYTLRVEMTDLAGRTASAEKSFSVNRYGSDYKLTAPQDVNGKYVTSTGDFVIEEVNVNALLDDSIVLTLFTADSAGKTLKLNEDYSYERDGKINRYTIFAKNFTNDSVYTLTLYSKDAAGNQNDSTDASKEMTIEFVVDKVAPIITSETLDTAERDNNKPKAESLDAVFAVTDNHELNLNTLEFTVNGEEVQYTVDEQGKYHITLKENRAWQKVSVTVLDTAGNAAETVEAEALVSTNIFVRWFNNTPVFIGSLVGVAVLAAIIIVLVVKRKKSDEE